MRFELGNIICLAMGILNILLGIMELFDEHVDFYGSCTCIVCGLVCLIPLLLRIKGLVKLNLIFIVAIVLALTFHSLGVLVNGYDVFDDYDTITHTFSSFLVSLCVWMTLCCYDVYNPNIHLNNRVMMTSIMLIMAGFSIYWEVFEYLLDTATGTHSQYSPFDTAKDTVLNMTGSFITVIYSGLIMRKHSTEQIVESFELNPRLKDFISNRKS